MYKIYYNRRAIGDVLIIVFNQEKIADKIVSFDDVTALYNNEKLIGINIFDFSRISRIFHEGEICDPAPEFIELINHILINANLSPLKED